MEKLTSALRAIVLGLVALALVPVVVHLWIKMVTNPNDTALFEISNDAPYNLMIDGELDVRSR
jgi:hypothetical protein